MKILYKINNHKLLYHNPNFQNTSSLNFFLNVETQYYILNIILNILHLLCILYSIFYNNNTNYKASGKCIIKDGFTIN